MDVENKTNEEQETISIEDFNKLKETNNDLVQRLNFLEKEAKTAFTKRDELKDKIRELQEKKDEGESTKTDDKELQNLKSQLDSILSEKEQLQTEFQSYKEVTALERALSNVNIEAANDKTRNIITDMLKSNATMENGQIVYKSPDGTTLYNDGKPVTLEHKLKDLQNDESLRGLFAPTVKQGSGSSPSNGNKVLHKDVTKMTHTEKAKLMKELGEEKYLELVKASLV
jgi:ribosomal protein L16 Arg81 hydroxylase